MRSATVNSGTRGATGALPRDCLRTRQEPAALKDSARITLAEADNDPGDP